MTAKIWETSSTSPGERELNIILSKQIVIPVHDSPFAISPKVLDNVANRL